MKFIITILGLAFHCFSLSGASYFQDSSSFIQYAPKAIIEMEYAFMCDVANTVQEKMGRDLYKSLYLIDVTISESLLNEAGDFLSNPENGWDRSGLRVFSAMKARFEEEKLNKTYRLNKIFALGDEVLNIKTKDPISWKSTKQEILDNYARQFTNPQSVVGPITATSVESENTPVRPDQSIKQDSKIKSGIGLWIILILISLLIGMVLGLVIAYFANIGIGKQKDQQYENDYEHLEKYYLTKFPDQNEFLKGKASKRAKYRPFLLDFYNHYQFAFRDNERLSIENGPIIKDDSEAHIKDTNRKSTEGQDSRHSTDQNFPPHDQLLSAKRHRPRIKEYYLTIPDENGEFEDSFKSEVEDKSRLYKLTVNENEQSGKLEYLSGKKDTTSIGRKDAFIKPVCQIENESMLNPMGIVMEEPGTVVKRGDKWCIQDKIKIRFV